MTLRLRFLQACVSAIIKDGTICNRYPTEQVEEASAEIGLQRTNEKKRPRTDAEPGNSGADNGARTRDPNLGKVVLYQLSHVRIRRSSAVL